MRWSFRCESYCDSWPSNNFRYIWDASKSLQDAHAKELNLFKRKNHLKSGTNWFLSVLPPAIHINTHRFIGERHCHKYLFERQVKLELSDTISVATLNTSSL